MGWKAGWKNRVACPLKSYKIRKQHEFRLYMCSNHRKSKGILSSGWSGRKFSSKIEGRKSFEAILG
jgi:hypothetical protein